MTPEIKAKELVCKFYDTFIISWEYDNSVCAKECAIIAVDEILKSGLLVMLDDEQYWYDVQKEIEKL